MRLVQAHNTALNGSRQSKQNGMIVHQESVLFAGKGVHRPSRRTERGQHGEK
ncbi:MAG: hypothetical protein QGI86_13040 [Candidatus Poribacteria bacterium]|nr:hypothetical protein [Candidatus Poribacteria bacterium]MDP6746898.1 hypothetical protein [Candidatus Poribacteria bacterium]